MQLAIGAKETESFIIIWMLKLLQWNSLEFFSQETRVGTQHQKKWQNSMAALLQLGHIYKFMLPDSVHFQLTPRPKIQTN